MLQMNRESSLMEMVGHFYAITEGVALPMDCDQGVYSHVSAGKDPVRSGKDATRGGKDPARAGRDSARDDNGLARDDNDVTRVRKERARVGTNLLAGGNDPARVGPGVLAGGNGVLSGGKGCSPSTMLLLLPPTKTPSRASPAATGRQSCNQLRRRTIFGSRRHLAARRAIDQIMLTAIILLKRYGQTL